MKSKSIPLSVFIPMSIILLTAIIYGVVAPKQFLEAENAIVQFAFQHFGWLFQLSGNIFLIFLFTQLSQSNILLQLLI